ncbi:hypothetical protein [Streptomyces sp. NPDC046759]
MRSTHSTRATPSNSARPERFFVNTTDAVCRYAVILARGAQP